MDVGINHLLSLAFAPASIVARSPASRFELEASGPRRIDFLLCDDDDGCSTIADPWSNDEKLDVLSFSNTVHGAALRWRIVRVGLLGLCWHGHERWTQQLVLAAAFRSGRSSS